MKTMKQLMGAFFVTGAAFALFVACSTTGDDCALDSDCSADQVCEDSVCVAVCSTTADCPAGESCEPRASGDGSVCKSSASNNTNNVNNVNNMNNMNNSNNMGATYNFFMVEDTSIGAEACDDVTDPGSDLQFVRVTDGAATLGYGLLRTPEFGDEPGGNDYIDTNILDGNPPAFNGDCTDDFADTSVVSMGCGGRFVFQALGSDGVTPLQLEAGVHTLEIGEYGVECNGSAADTYNVYGCAAAADGSSSADCFESSWGNEISGIGIVDVL